MKVFIANFGQENHLWPSCLAKATIATFEDEDLWPLRQAHDRDGYIARCIETKQTAAGITPTKQVASRWFNLLDIVSTTEGDLWIHREKDELWWTTSRPGAPEVVTEPAFRPTSLVKNVYVCHKPAAPWSNKSRRGNALVWQGLHARAREFLFTEGTLQELRPKNADYAQALIGGDSLDSWHALGEWKDKAERAKREPVAISTRESARWRGWSRLPTTRSPAPTARSSNVRSNAKK